MSQATSSLRVLHSFPHRLGMSRICTTAWYEIDSAAKSGVEMHVLTGDSVKPIESAASLRKTLAFWRIRIPARIIGVRRLCMLHDFVVSKRLPAVAGKIDVIHAWPLGSLRTIRVAKKLGIPVALERCNAHTRFAYEVVEKECSRIGVPLPPGHEHYFDERIVRLEEQEYAEAQALLCPSEFTAKTFVDRGVPSRKIVRFIYGVDEKRYFPSSTPKTKFVLIYVGVAAVRKGLHFALDAWLNSEASKSGEFWIVGGFIPAYQEKLKEQLSHPSVKVLGHRNDVPELMRTSTAFILPSIEEGFGLVCTEAMASGAVPIVSEACTDICKHGVNSLVHRVGDVAAIREHIDKLASDPAYYSRLQESGLRALPSYTWKAAGESLKEAYEIVHRMAK